MNPTTNPPFTTADAVMAEVADPLDALLRQIVGGYFVLTDGQGSVSKWSEPAELLFDQPADSILGQSFFETLIGGTLPPAGEAWRAFLDHGETPQAAGTVRLTGRRADGDTFPLEAVFVPVKLDEGFDFSLFLEDLAFELPLNLMLLRMRQQHPVVVRALLSAIEPEPQPWEGWRTAGTLVVFRPLEAARWVEAELERRTAEREAVDAQTEERLTNFDPGVQGSFNDLDDAAAVVARLLSAVERIDELERVAGDLPAQVEEARRDGDTLRSDVQRALAGVPSELDRVEQLARLERLERARLEGETTEAERRQALVAAEAATSRLAARLDQLERDRDAAESVADSRLAEAVAAAEECAAEAIAESTRRLDARLAEEPDVSGQIERLRAEHEAAAQAARVELAETISALEREREREREAARAELAGALERVEHVQRDADAVREQLSAITVERAAAAGVADDDRRRVDDLQRDTDALRARVEAMREQEQRTTELTDELAEVRETVARHEAAARELPELLDAVARHEAAADDTVARHEALADQVAQLRSEAGAVPAEVAELRRLLSEQQAAAAELRENAAGRVSEAEAVERHVHTLAGDTQRQIAALHERIDLAAGRDELAELRAELDRLDGLVSRDELAERVEGLVGREELTDRVEGLVGRDELADRLGALAALNERVDDLSGARDELVARLHGLAARDELTTLREHVETLDPGVAEQALATANDALDRIMEVDRGAGSVLADVSALRELVDEALAAAQRGRTDSDELRELIVRHGGELEVASGQADRAQTEALGARQAAAAAGEAANSAREDAAHAREESAATRRDVDGQQERTMLLAEQLSDVRETAIAARDDVRTGQEALTERLTAVDQRAAALGTELGVGRERLDALGAHIDRLGTSMLETGEAVDAANERTATLRSELGEVRHVAETAARGLDVLRSELSSFREVAEAVRADAASARAAAAKGDERIEAMQSELTFAINNLDELKQGLSSAGQAAVIARREAEQARKAAQHVGDGSTERVTEVFQQILGLAAARNQPTRRPAVATTAASAPAELVEREPRHGFDDAATPMAILGLDGKFKQLNPAFAKLVGYKEHEFTKAAWPSPHDRRDYKDQLEQLRKIGLGELREIEVQSTYMHGQGLMVPVVGKLTLERAEDGVPSQLVLEAEDRHTG